MARLLLAFILFASPLYGASYTKVTVTTVAGQILPLSKNRAAWVIHNSGTSTVWIGFDSNVSSTTAIPILPNEKLLNDGKTAYKGAVYGITDTGTQDVRYLEWGNNDI